MPAHSCALPNFQTWQEKPFRLHFSSQSGNNFKNDKKFASSFFWNPGWCFKFVIKFTIAGIGATRG